MPFAFAQKPSSKLSQIEVSGYYDYIPLDEVYKDFTKKYGIRFKYNPNLLHSIKFWYLFDQTPIDLAIKITVRDNQLKYFVDAEGIVNVVPKSSIQKPQNLISSGGTIAKNGQEVVTGNSENSISGNNLATKVDSTTKVSSNPSIPTHLAQVQINEVFNDVSLDKAFTRLMNKYNIDINYNKERAKEIYITHLFEETSADEVIDILVREANTKVRENFFSFDINGPMSVRISEENVGSQKKTATTYKKFIGEPQKKDFTLTGIIRDRNTGESLPFVNIITKGGRIVTQSNVDGYFTLVKVPTDTSLITLNYLGYKPLQIFLSPTMPVKDVVVEMEASASTTLQEIQVKGERDVLSASEKVSMLKLTPARIATLPNMGEKDMFRAFQMLPGISAANENAAGMYVRGGTPDQTLVLFDGFTVYNVDHLYGFFSAFNNNAIKDIQLYKGGFEAKYGGRLSAVAEITGKEGNRKRLSAGLDLTLLSANAYVEAPVGDKLTVLVAARRSYQGLIYNLVTSKFKTSTSATNSSAATGNPVTGGRFGSNSNTPSSYFYDLNSKITYHPNDKDIFTFSIYNGGDVVDNSRKNSFGNGAFSATFNNTDLSTWGNTGFSLKWSRTFNNRFYGNSMVSYSNYYSQRNLTNQASRTLSDGTTSSFQSGTIENNSLNDFSFKSDYEWKLNNTNDLEFGAHLTHFNIIYNYSQNDTVKIVDNNDFGNQYTAYVQNRIKLGNRLSVVPGVRATIYSPTSKLYFEPRLSASFSLTEKIKLKAAIGQYYQFTKRVIREDLSNGSRDFWVLANNSNIPVSSSQHYILGTSYETDHFLFDVEGYYKPLQDITEFTLRYNTIGRQINASENYYIGSGLAKGIDFLLQKKSGKYNGWIGYTLGETTHNISIYGTNDYPTSNNVTHEFKIVNMYKWRKWDFALTWIYASGRPYTTPQGAYQLTLPDGTNKNYVTAGSKNAERLPDYHRMDASATYNFKWDVMKGSLGFSLFNLYNRSNVWYKTFDINSGTIAPTDITYLNLTPNISFSLKY
jgi:ferric enterobactin receptor